jgi:hypothetical protein
MKKKINISKNYFFSEIIKKSQTTKSDLEFLAKKLNFDVKINWLKDADPNYMGPQIINLGNPTIGGTHWCASYNGVYFDPFGMVPPQKFEDAGYEWVSLPIQNMNYGRCGSYCILWLWYAKENELDQFYNLFQIDPNDVI